jgi:hypothetical protein
LSGYPLLFAQAMKQGILCAVVASIVAVLPAAGHEIDFKHIHGPTNKPPVLKLTPETKGPVSAPAKTKSAAATTGQGFWKFAAMKDLVPTPEETKPFLKGAHGTIVVDTERDLVYWGLEKVGWVAFSNNLANSWVVKGDAKFTSGNLHGADILPRKGGLPLIVAADNVEGEVYLSDTSFGKAEILGRPEGPYQNTKARFMPTDAAFIDAKNIYATDGYGSQWFMHATTSPLKYDGTYIGGSEFSRTPHGITKRASGTLLVAARPEAQIKEFSPKKGEWLESLALPPGSTVCDVDVWGDYALAPCLDGPKGADGKATHGPIYIVNLKTKTIASIIKVKDDLGYELADHIHDAAWYVRGEGNNREVYIIFTNWNPGGVGAIKLVNAPDAQ